MATAANKYFQNIFNSFFGVATQSPLGPTTFYLSKTNIELEKVDCEITTKGADYTSSSCASY